MAKTGLTRKVALTARQKELLRLLAKGLPRKEIAERMGITVKTVWWHWEAILNAFGTRSAFKGALLARDAGLV